MFGGLPAASAQRQGARRLLLALPERRLLRVSSEAARLRVTGSFALDDSERTLAALAETLPIAVRRRTDYWVTIVPR